MGVRINVSKTYRTQVNFTVIDEAGKSEAMSFEAEFKRLDRDGVKELIDTKPNDTEMCREVLTGWKMKDLDSKEDIPFTDATFDEFLKIPGAAGVTMLRFMETVGASRAKN